MHKHYKLALFLSLIVCIALGCATTERIVTDGEQQYKVTETKILGYSLSKTRKPIVSAMQQILADLRQQKLETQAMYRSLARYCAIGAIVCLVIGYLTKYGEATGAAAILGGSSLVCAWLSVALGLWWLVLIAAALLLAVYIALKVRGFHAPDAIKSKIQSFKEKAKDARVNRNVQIEK